MTIFKSRKVNLDPEPYLQPESGVRSRHNVSSDWRLDPRPEFEPTRDWAPWVDPQNGHRYMTDNPTRPARSEFRPNREQFDTPVNPILVAFRMAFAARHPLGVQNTAELAEAWLDNWYAVWFSEVEGTLAERAHAYKVLTLFANLKETA